MFKMSVMAAYRCVLRCS